MNSNLSIFQWASLNSCAGRIFGNCVISKETVWKGKIREVRNIKALMRHLGVCVCSLVWNLTNSRVVSSPKSPKMLMVWGRTSSFSAMNPGFERSAVLFHLCSSRQKKSLQQCAASYQKKCPSHFGLKGLCVSVWSNLHVLITFYWPHVRWS